MSSLEGLIDPLGAAEMLTKEGISTSRWKVIRMVRAGELNGSKVGGRWVIQTSSVDDLIRTAKRAFGDRLEKDMFAQFKEQLRTGTLLLPEPFAHLDPNDFDDDVLREAVAAGRAMVMAFAHDEVPDPAVLDEKTRELMERMRKMGRAIRLMQEASAPFPDEEPQEDK